MLIVGCILLFYRDGLLGYTQKQMAQSLFADSQAHINQCIQKVRFYQSKAAERLGVAGYPIADGKREQIQNVISNNRHEVRSIIIPLYPWPERLVLSD